MSLDEGAPARQRLEGRLRALGTQGRVAVALSAGVDSTLLLEVARRVLGGGVVALTATSPFVPVEEVRAARALCEERGVEHVVVDFDPLAVEGVGENPRNRCYLCKRALMGMLMEAARARGCAVLVDGTNADDVSGTTFRPGLRALAELGIKSPLAEAGLTKAEVRALARELALEAWDKPAAACLATRFPYGTRLTREGLARVAAAERILRGCGLTQVRVRVHGDRDRSINGRDDLAHSDDACSDLARIEVLPEEFALLLADGRAAAIDRELRALGFARVTLDLAGFASGSWD